MGQTEDFRMMTSDEIGRFKEWYGTFSDKLPTQADVSKWIGDDRTNQAQVIEMQRMKYAMDSGLMNPTPALQIGGEMQPAPGADPNYMPPPAIDVAKGVYEKWPESPAKSLVGGLAGIPKTEDLKTPEEKMLSLALDAGGMSSGQIKAFHGSPHKFTKFSTEKIGTGEGAQAFGHGLYFTSEKDIAKYYATGGPFGEWTINGQPLKEGIKSYDKLNSAGPGQIVTALEDYVYTKTGNLNIKQAKDELRNLAVRIEKRGDKDIADFYNQLSEVVDKIQYDKNAGIYSVTLHKGKESGEYDYLKWDEPVSETQISKIKTAYDDVTNREKDWHKASELSREFDKIKHVMSDKANGEQYYKALSRVLGSEKEASAVLLRAGIDGIEYPAGSLSGATGKGKNFVVFDENAITIDK